MRATPGRPATSTPCWTGGHVRPKAAPPTVGLSASQLRLRVQDIASDLRGHRPGQHNLAPSGSAIQVRATYPDIAPAAAPRTRRGPGRTWPGQPLVPRGPGRP